MTDASEDSRYLLGQGYYLVGDLTQALSQFKAALTIIEQKDLLSHPAVLLWTAETGTRLGLPEAATPHLQTLRPPSRTPACPVEALAKTDTPKLIQIKIFQT